MTQVIEAQQPAEAGGPSVRVLLDRCAGCEACVVRCPVGALSIDGRLWVADVDESACVGCRQCVRTCPFSAIEVEGPVLVADRVEVPDRHPTQLLGDAAEIRGGFAGWDEALLEASRCLECPDPTCVRGCPAHNDIPAFIAAIRQRDLAGAHAVLRRTSVLPDVCSRVCNQAAQCEGACSWSLAGDVPVAIGKLERFVTDQMPVPAPEPAPRADDELSVAIVGAGPAAAGAAWELVEAGATVTVFERDGVPGGLCSWGIPDFTLPDRVALRAWDQLVDAGVELRCNTAVGPEDLEHLGRDHDAVILANGAPVPMRLSVPGADLENVTDATTFLKAGRDALAHAEGAGAAALYERFGVHPEAGDSPASRLLVLGAGNTAMDVARTARRLGLEATCVDWLDERFALTRPDELAEARGEGVEVRFCRTLTALRGEDGRAVHAELASTTQAVASRAPEVQHGPPEVLDIDLVVMAMGYRLDPSFGAVTPGTPVRRQTDGVPNRHWMASGILAGPASPYAGSSPVGQLALGREVGLWAAAAPVVDRVWVVGDALIGPSTVVEAMAQGRRAALSVLGARPTRPGGPPRGGPARVLVCYESEGGTTARVAEGVGAAFAEYGDTVRVLPIGKVGAPELSEADVVVLGTWVEGLVVAKVGPAPAMRAWLAKLPRLGGKAVGLFCTYGVAPRTTLAVMAEQVESRGAHLLGQGAFAHPRPGRRGQARLRNSAEEFGRALAAELHATRTASAVAGG